MITKGNINLETMRHLVLSAIDADVIVMLAKWVSLMNSD